MHTATPKNVLVANEKHRNRRHPNVLDELHHPIQIETIDLHQNVYEINFGQNELYRFSRATIDFAKVVVGPGKEMLCDPQNSGDLLTAKVLVIKAVTLVRQDTKSADYVRTIVRTFGFFLRWRNAQGLRRISDLRPFTFSRYMEYVTDPGLRERDRLLQVDLYLSRIAQERGHFPKKKKGVDWSEVAREIGIQSGHGLSEACRSRAMTFLESYDPELFENEILRRASAPTTLKEDADFAAPTIGSIERLLQPWQDLWNHRKYLQHDPLQFDALGGIPVGTIARRVGKPHGRTGLIPAYQACYLLDQAERWVIDYAPTILGAMRNLRSKLEDFHRTNPNGKRWQIASGRKQIFVDVVAEITWPAEMKIEGSAPLAIEPVYHFSSEADERLSERRLSLHKLIFECLPLACAILIGMYGARRRGELESLVSQCLCHDDDGLWLSMWIEKSLRDLDKIPVPPSVGIAIAILEEISASARDATGKPWLLQYEDCIDVKARFPGISVKRTIGVFAQVAGVPPLADGSFWSFTSHQLRKLFAVIYVYRFKYGSLPALSYHLRQFNIEVSRRYVTEQRRGAYVRYADERQADDRTRQALSILKERASMIDEIQAQFVRELFRDIANGEEWLAGPGGRTISARVRSVLRDIGRKISITNRGDSDGETLNSALDSLAREFNLQTHPDGHSLCKCRDGIRQDVEAANCIRQKAFVEGPTAFQSIGADFAYAAPETCADCIHNVQCSWTLQRWVESTVRLTSIAESSLEDVLREDAEKVRGIIERYHASCQAELERQQSQCMLTDSG